MTDPTYILGGTTGDMNAYGKSFGTNFDNVGWTPGDNILSVAIRAKITTGAIRAFLYADDSDITTVLWSSAAQTPGADLTWTTFNIADGSPTSLTVPVSGKIWLVTNFSTNGTYGYSEYKTPNDQTHVQCDPNAYGSMPISPITNVSSTGSYMNCGISTGEAPSTGGTRLPPPPLIARF